MAIINAIMVPHPPLILPQVGRGEEKGIQATVDAYRRACRFVAEAGPDVLAVTTPHSVAYADWFHISPGPGASGSFGQFRAPEVRVDAEYDTALVDELCRLARKEDLPAGTAGEKSAALDHATMIPLYFLKEAYGDAPLPPIVRIGLSGLPLTEHYRLGMLLREAAPIPLEEAVPRIIEQQFVQACAQAQRRWLRSLQRRTQAAMPPH